MAKRFYKEESRANWYTEGDCQLSTEEIQLGAILRIADATEKMAQNYIELQDKLKRTQNWNEDLRFIRDQLQRSNAALKGHITRLKKKLELLNEYKK
jgi:hypothetical protein